MTRIRSTSPFALLAALAIAIAGPNLSAKAPDFTFAEPTIVGVQFFAEWSPACEELDPKVNKALGKFVEAPALFTRFDMSNLSTQYQASQLAGALGLSDLYKRIGVKTGFVILIDRASGKEIGRIERNDTTEEIIGKVQDALNKTAP